MSETWYKVRLRWAAAAPEAVTVERFTDSTVFVAGRRRARSTQYEIYFPTYDEAVAHLVATWERRVEADKARLNASRTQLGMAQSFAKARP